MVESERLILRNWKDSDQPVFAQMNTDPKVMEFLPKSFWGNDGKEVIARIKNSIETNGYGMWAMERKDTGEFIGFTGLHSPTWEAHFTPCIEVGWRLASKYWGQGFATEGALASLDYGFNKMNLDEIVSFTVPDNTRSRKVMDRIGMTYDKSGDFNHPTLPENDPLSQHVLYRLSKKDYIGHS